MKQHDDQYVEYLRQEFCASGYFDLFNTESGGIGVTNWEPVYLSFVGPYFNPLTRDKWAAAEQTYAERREAIARRRNAPADDGWTHIAVPKLHVHIYWAPDYVCDCGRTLEQAQAATYIARAVGAINAPYEPRLGCGAAGDV